jgi:hypothetical protein
VILIRETDRAAWTLAVIGLILAVTAFLIHRPEKKFTTG